jgi:hypothetical protein
VFRRAATGGTSYSGKGAVAASRRVGRIRKLRRLQSAYRDVPALPGFGGQAEFSPDCAPLGAELRDVLTRAAGHPRADLAAEFAAVRALTPDQAHPLAEDLVREGRSER